MDALVEHPSVGDSRGDQEAEEEGCSAKAVSGDSRARSAILTKRPKPGALDGEGRQVIEVALLSVVGCPQLCLLSRASRFDLPSDLAVVGVHARAVEEGRNCSKAWSIRINGVL